MTRKTALDQLLQVEARRGSFLDVCPGGQSRRSDSSDEGGACPVPSPGGRVGMERGG